MSRLLPAPDKYTQTTQSALLLEAVALLREIRDLLARPAPRAPLTRADLTILRKLLPAIEGDRGSEPFASRDLLMSSGSRVIVGRLHVKQIGKLLAKAEGVPIDGHVLESAGIEINVPVVARAAGRGVVMMTTAAQAATDRVEWRRRELMPDYTRVASALPHGTAFARYVMCLGHGGGDAYRTLEAARQFRNTPHVLEALETKAAVAVGTTSDATWAGPLAVYGIAGEALQLLRGASIIGALESKMRRVPFRTKVPRETGSGSGGAWVGEGLATPAAATAYDTLTQEVYKAAKIVVLSDELLKLGDPDAERTVRETLIAGVAAFLDAQFLTNTVTLSANLRPAAITNGATAIASTGSTAAQINADLAGMLAAITTDGGGLVWIMKPMTAAKIAATIGGTAAVDLPRTLFGIPVVLSVNSPAQITLVDAAHILYSDTGGFDVDISRHAAIEMNDAPTNPPVAATVIESLFPRNLFGIRVTRWLAYLRAQTGAVVYYMTVAY